MTDQKLLIIRLSGCKWTCLPRLSPGSNCPSSKAITSGEKGSTFIHFRLNNLFARSFKIAPRGQNAHAYVNAAFLAKVDGAFKVTEQPRIVYGGVSGSFHRAVNTEAFLIQKSLNDGNVLKEALDVLQKEAVPDNDPKNSTPQYRQHLTKALLYKVQVILRTDSLVVVILV